MKAEDAGCCLCQWEQKRLTLCSRWLHAMLEGKGRLTLKPHFLIFSLLQRAFLISEGIQEASDVPQVKTPVHCEIKRNLPGGVRPDQLCVNAFCKGKRTFIYM